MEDYDAYHLWLGIPPEEQPPSHYRLLGVPLFEAHAEVIRNAADRQRAHVKRLGVNEFEKIGQDLMNEIEVAKLCLLRAEKKVDYDRRLRQEIEQQPDKAQQSSTLKKELSGETLIVGSDKNCDIVVDLPIVSGVHCSVTRREDTVVLRDLKSTNGTRVNFRAVTKPTRITPAELIFLGRDTRLKLPRAFYPEAMRQKSVGFVGRNEQCEIQIQDHTVSAFHARITFDDGLVLAEDLESTNGTLVAAANERLRRIEPLTTVVLNDYAELGFGEYRISAAAFIAEHTQRMTSWD